MEKTITLYAKTTGCHQCDLTKKKLAKEGVLSRTKIIYIDQPENAGILESFKAEGITQVPIVLTNFPVTLDGAEVDCWIGFNPAAIESAAATLKEGK